MISNPVTDHDHEHQELAVSMRPAQIRQRRTLADGRRLVNVVCPVCDRRHWLPASGVGKCPRRPGRFTIVADTVGRAR